MPTATVENYLKQIYLLEQTRDGETVPIGAVAEALAVVPGTATVMVQRLAQRDQVEYEPYGGVRLTSTGRRLALDVLRRHRLIESFLVDVLGLDWSEVHVEAELLEHAISDKLLAHIDRYLGSPAFDPHGDPIPGPSGDVRELPTIALSACEPGVHMRIARVASQDEEFLRFVAEHGLRPGTHVTVAANDPIGETVTVVPRVGAPVTIGYSAAEKLLASQES